MHKHTALIFRPFRGQHPSYSDLLEDPLHQVLPLRGP